MMKALTLCVELGVNTIIDAKRQGIPLDAIAIKREPFIPIIDTITVKPIDLSLYDRMFKKEAAL